MKNSIDNLFEKSFIPEAAAELPEINKDIKFTDLPSSAGLVLLADHQNNPIALLTAANIRRTVKNKLAEQLEKTKRADLKSITAKVYYSAIPCKFRLAMNHYAIVKKLFAEKYKDHLTLVYPWYLTININDRIPFFCATTKPKFKNGEKILGPFSTQRAASVFMTALEDVFKLCRKSEFANNPQHSKSCPYLQMDACAGVCAGKITFEEYKNLIEQAFSAGAEPDTAINNFQTEMQIAAKDLNFEKAAALKKKIEKLSALKKPAYKWTGDLRKLNIVHIDKSFKIKSQGEKTKKQTYAVFVMNIFKIIDAGDFLKDNPEEITNAITKNLEQLSNSPVDEMFERFAIVTYFLYRSKPSGLWLNTGNQADLEKIENFV